MHSGGVPPPPPSQSQQAALSPSSTAPDPSFDLQANVVSSVTLLPSPTMPSSAVSAAPLTHTQAAAPPAAAVTGDAFAFMANIPSPVMLPSSQQGQGSDATILPVSPALPPPSQLAMLPSHIAAGDSTLSFMAKAQAQSGQGVDNVCLFSFTCFQLF